MRRSVLLFCLLCVGCGSGPPEVPWEAIELGTDASFRDIFFLDADNGWMVGDVGLTVPGGIIARTRDGGDTWQYTTRVIAQRSKASSIDLNAVWFFSGDVGVIAAESGVMLRTDDGGGSWQTIPPTGPVYAHHRDLDFIDSLNGWVIGRRGVLRTEDGGASWQRIDEGLDAAGQAFDMLDAQEGWMVGKFGLVHRTVDGGVTWELVPACGDLDGLGGDEKPHLTGVHFVDRDHGWIAGYVRELTGFEQHDRAVIVHTDDGGRTWTPQLEGVEALLTAIRFADRQRGWCVGFNRNDGTSVILATGDGGRAWAVQQTVHGEELKALAIRDGHVWTAGDRVRDLPQRLFRLAFADSSGSGQGVDEGQ